MAVKPISLAAAPLWATQLACALFLVACLAIYVIATVAPDHSGSAYIVLHLTLTLAMLTAWRWSGNGGATPLRLILLTGIVARLLLIPAPMLSSNDAERYLWDGAVALAGLDPYSVRPDDAIVADMRTIWATPPEHGAYPTLYPPVALALFALSALAGPQWGIWLWKLGAALIGILLLWLSNHLLRRCGLERHLALVALSPLLVLEVGVGAHLDGLVALTIVSALLAFYANRFGWAGALLGVGIGIKLLPVAALAALALTAGWRHGARMVTAAAGTLGGIYGAALAVGWRPVGSLPVFFEKWRNGSPLFTLLESQLAGQALLFALGALAAVAAVLILFFARRRTILAAQIAVATPLLLSPVTFPWYLSALVPLSALMPSATLLIWLTTSPLIYEVRDRFVSDGVWMPALWPLVIIGVGWIIGLTFDAARYYRRKSKQD